MPFQVLSSSFHLIDLYRERGRLIMQETWINERANYVMSRSGRAHFRPGQCLWTILPGEFQQIMTDQNVLWDPYHMTLERKHEVAQWLREHITFSNDGEMIVLRNLDDVVLDLRKDKDA